MNTRKFLILFISFSILLFGCSKKTTTVTNEKEEKSMEKTQKQTMVLISTNYGDIKLALYNETPQHRDNFIQIVKNKSLDSTLFHRVIKQFMIQGGDPTSKTARKGQQLGAGDLGYKVPAEINSTLFHKKGALAAARDNNPQKSSSACQFYIVQGKTYTDQELDMISSRTGRQFTTAQREMYKTLGGVPFLDGDYTVFGEVVEGLEVVDKIAEVRTDRNDRPLEDIRMVVKIIEE
ncbi:MAG: peptidylprolyl isomerase [Bacteroidales bacterium]|jgi:peptidyl-prolyl cis-trans isomerase B (cyclophilin B)|nr:peptidylprolyl isomerase [Bacteroidales bacterium]MDY6394444.1 peptidylprolyl isomerase [Bacteroidales bacterium]MDY6395137.1 peptidylprolyl isomerase [Bacteroidales bacterium]MDY6402613.1 peptidylprolyl isomerase [Bacteroidales bacterium]MDY6424397.1 peptidylprolyl isomerase [Bacteroidales bacterium]